MAIALADCIAQLVDQERFYQGELSAKDAVIDGLEAELNAKVAHLRESTEELRLHSITARDHLQAVISAYEGKLSSGRELLENILGRDYRTWVAADCFCTWRAYAGHLAIARSISLLEAATRQAHVEAEAAAEAIRGFQCRAAQQQEAWGAAEAARKNMVMRRVAQKIAGSTVASSFGAWLLVVEGSRKVRATEECLERRKRQLLRQCVSGSFAEWRAAAVVTRTLEDKALMLTRRRSMRLASRFALGWRNTSREQARLRSVFRRAVGRFRSQTLTAALENWLEAVAVLRCELQEKEREEGARRREEEEREERRAEGRRAEERRRRIIGCALPTL